MNRDAVTLLEQVDGYLHVLDRVCAGGRLEDAGIGRTDPGALGSGAAGCEGADGRDHPVRAGRGREAGRGDRPPLRGRDGGLETGWAP